MCNLIYILDGVEFTGRTGHGFIHFMLFGGVYAFCVCVCVLVCVCVCVLGGAVCRCVCVRVSQRVS